MNDEITIVDPRTGHGKYKIHTDNRVETLACEHELDRVSQECTKCGLAREKWEKR